MDLLITGFMPQNQVFLEKTTDLLN